MNFLFVDRILSMEPGRKVVGLKHVTPSDTYLFKTHDNQVALYTCVIGEALGQLCSWGVIQGTEYGKRLIGGVVGEVTLHSEPLVGETVILETEIDVLDTENNVCHFQARAKVGDRLIVELKDGLGPIMDVAEFGSVDNVKAEYKALFRPGEVPVLPEGQALACANIPDTSFLQYDRVINWTKGESMLAQKNISMTAPYFHDHFPRKKVLPVTLMIQSNLLLGHEFLSDLINDNQINENQRLQPKVVRRVKMNDFVAPGTIIMTTVKMKKQEANSFTLVFRSESEGKRVCVCEAEFEVIDND